jgi:hypothetical protein
MGIEKYGGVYLSEERSLAVAASTFRAIYPSIVPVTPGRD